MSTAAVESARTADGVSNRLSDAGLPSDCLPNAVEFAVPPPGLEPACRFTLSPIEGAAGLFSLSSVDAGARLFLLDAAMHLPDYTPRLAARDLELIGAERIRTEAAAEPGDTETAGPGATAGAAVVLVVVTPGSPTTLNLAAPILVNRATGSCIQAILEGGDWPLRAPLTVP